MKPSRLLAILTVVGFAVSSPAAEPEKEEPPILVVVGPETQIDLGRLFNSVNREFMRRRIEEYRSYAAREENPRARIHQDVRMWEKALAQLKPDGKVLPGATHVAIFEEGDTFVVAYFDYSRIDHFVCSFSKVDYLPLPDSAQPPRKAANITQKSLIVQ